ncbi:hypothetical protein FB480_105195 [Agrobacterium vitis]|nr:hypothetical protein FB480_105195 [Agrobacterium vitis]
MSPSNVAHWDRELTTHEIAKLDRASTLLRTTTSLERKVALLEAMKTDFALFRRHIDVIPWTPTSLRKWQDLQLRLWSWSSSEVEKHPDRTKLMERYNEVLADLRKMQKLAEKFSTGELASEETIQTLQVEARIRAEYEPILAAKNMENENLKEQVIRLMEALRLANKKIGVRPTRSR